MMSCHSSRHSRRGVALVIVLSMIVLITVLVVGFTANMRTERQASQSASENERTKLVAEAALAHAISILSQNIPQPAPIVQPSPSPTPTPSALTNWSVSPGMLNLVRGPYVFTPNSVIDPSIVTQIPLSTNPIDHVPDTSDANLNLLQAGSNQYPILGSNAPMYVAWAPLLQNPGKAASKDNPLVARYAFWIDDENAKININTAYGKPANMDYSKLTPGVIKETATSPDGTTTDTFPLGHPASVNLDIFNTLGGPQLDLGMLANNIKTHGVATSPEAIKNAFTSGTDADAFYQKYKFYLTATSRDPEFNAFGKSRLFMYAGPTGQLDTAGGGGMFQRFRDLDAPMYFHGNENRDPAASPPPNSTQGGNPYQDYSAMYYTAANLSSIFNRATWPGMITSSFVDKWNKDKDGNDLVTLIPQEIGKREADQVAWNIVTMGSILDTASYTAATPGALSATYGNRLPPFLPTTPPTPLTGSSGSINYPNAAVQIGSLSGRAIIPVTPRPMVDEICLNILPEAVTVAGATKYRLKFTASYGVWVPPGYPAADLSQSSCDLFVGLTHLEYVIQENGAPKASQADSKYLNNGYEGVKKMQALNNTDTIAPDQRLTVLSIRNGPNPDLTPQFYARNGSGFSNSTVGVASFAPVMVNVTMRMRLYVHSLSPAYVAATQAPASQLIPVWDKHDPGATLAPTSWNAAAPDPNGPYNQTKVYKAFYPPADDLNDYVEFKFDLDLSRLGGMQCTRSLYVADPRLGGLARMWQSSWKDTSRFDPATVATVAQTDTLAKSHNGATETAVAAGWQLNKFSYPDMTAGSALPHPSTGLFSSVPTGMQRGIIGSTLKLQPNPKPATELPDWLLLDLFAPTVSPPAGSTAWAEIVKMNATAGKINVNAGIYPNAVSFAPPARLLPLQALFSKTPAGSGVAQNIISHTLAGGGHYYAGVDKFYSYPGEICEIAGVADSGNTDWDKEATVRNLASAITTKSNTFSVWGVAQTIKKPVTHHRYGIYEPGDVVTGEKRFQAIVERYVWPGVDGIAGNGHVGSNGTYDLLTQGTTKPGAGPTPAAANPYDWEMMDGPDAPTYPTKEMADRYYTYSPYVKNVPSSYPSPSPSPSGSDMTERANNPVRATMKYHVISFRYLD